MELTYGILQKIIETLEEKDNIFSNEAQFQFALAQAIKDCKYFKNENPEVLLEHLILIKDKKDNEENEENKKRIKMYIDIIVKIGNDYYPIELKYKTANKTVAYQKKNDLTIYTFKQGAEDIGSYDFIKDIYRIEQLVFGINNEEKLTVKFKGKDTEFESPYFDYTSLSKKPDFKKGFAIMITNDDKYNKEYKDKKLQLKKDGSHYYWEQFFLSEGRTLKDTLYWVNDSGEKFKDSQTNNKDDENKKEKIIKSVSVARFKPIRLRGKYTLNWNDYDVIGDNIQEKNEYSFKYLLVEVSSEEKTE